MTFATKKLILQGLKIGVIIGVSLLLIKVFIYTQIIAPDLLGEGNYTRFNKLVVVFFNAVHGLLIFPAHLFLFITRWHTFPIGTPSELTTEFKLLSNTILLVFVFIMSTLAPYMKARKWDKAFFYTYFSLFVLCFLFVGFVFIALGLG